ncbi:MAG: hypothetical protein WA154_11040 [Moraxellaceae bacterium]
MDGAAVKLKEGCQGGGLSSTGMWIRFQGIRTMARARNIKPGFFTNELLGTYDPIISLFFAGLWCLADRDGRLEDRPLRIKAELFPYREGLDINGYLTVLERDAFLVRYEVAGVRYIQISNFAKHQTPHHTEKAKGLPAPESESQQQRGEEGKDVLAPLKHGESQVPTRSDLLIPDSLIADSPKPGEQHQPPAKPSNVVELPTPDDRTGFAKAVALEYARAYGVAPPPVPLMLAMEIAARPEWEPCTADLSWWANYFATCWEDLFLTNRDSQDSPIGPKAATFKRLVSEECMADMIDRSRRDAAHG